MSATTLGMIGPLPRDQIASMSGRDVLDAILAGELPTPDFSVTMKIRPTEIGEGRIIFEGETSRAFLNPMGIVHGGWISTILDSAMGCAIHSTLKPGQIYTTTAMTIQFTRSLAGDGQSVRCEGVVAHSGGRTATAEGRLYDAKGRLVAHGSESCLIMDAQPQRAAA